MFVALGTTQLLYNKLHTRLIFHSILLSFWFSI